MNETCHLSSITGDPVITTIGQPISIMASLTKNPGQQITTVLCNSVGVYLNSPSLSHWNMEYGQVVVILALCDHWLQAALKEGGNPRERLYLGSNTYVSCQQATFPAGSWDSDCSQKKAFGWQTSVLKTGILNSPLQGNQCIITSFIVYGYVCCIHGVGVCICACVTWKEKKVGESTIFQGCFDDLQIIP